MQLGYDQKVRIVGQLGYFIVYTAAGYARKYKEDAAQVVERERSRGNPIAIIQRCATVISSDRGGMSAWDHAAQVAVGDVIEIDGEKYTVGAKPAHDDDYPLIPAA